MGKSFSEELERCADFADIFELVKTGVEKTLDRGRAGLMLGLANFGGGPGQFLGGYYTVDSNLIVLNSFPLDLIRKKDERLLKPYIFHVLLHEYIHSLGYHDEARTREITGKICEKLFGSSHPSARMATKISAFLPLFAYDGIGWFPDREPEIRIVRGFDKGHLTYVS